MQLQWIVVVSLLVFASNYAYSDCDEVGYLAVFDVKAGHEEEFEAAIVELSQKVMEVEEGVVLYSPYSGAESGRYYMFERYENEVARQAHAKSPAVRALFGPVMGALAEPADIRPVSLVCKK